MKSNYNKFPSTKIKGHEHAAVVGYNNILDTLKKEIPSGKYVITCDVYPGVRDEEILTELKKLEPSVLINMIDVFKEEKTITEQLKYILTDDRVFGKMYYGEVSDFIDMEKLEAAKQQVEKADGLVIVYGFGASLVHPGDKLVYFDMARWEIQMRYRAGMGNYKCSNYDEDPLRKNKRGFFIEWRIADKHKMSVFEDIDWLIDTNKANDPKMIPGTALRDALKQIAQQPFRTVPYFDPGVWGGQWMKEVCDLDREKSNFAWSFDGVPEENSLYLEFADAVVEIPAMDLVLYQPKPLLGDQVYARFGAEFPIRFDFLDTMGGQNLSLQVHPLTEYIKKQFGMQYTQDESYYMLDAGEGACVYLGLKDGVDQKQMIEDLRRANKGEIEFDAEKYINKFPAKKHDHFLIPAGTCHCSGSEAMVLEISATPYIFTFKLWDWGRVGLDGRPRPVHVEHGKEVIQWDRTTKWCEENLVNAIHEVKRTEDYVEEHTGLHELEFIETRRYWTETITHHDTAGTVNMLNLVEGREAVVESEEGKFEPFVVHYAETFIVPASTGKYTIRPYGESVGSKIGIIKAYVRNNS